MPLVEGEITFDQSASSFVGATVRVRLEDVTAADAPALLVAEEIERDVTFHPEAGATLPFALTGEPPDAGRSYAVRVHIDLDGDGEVSRGDYISTQSHPVLTFGYPRRVEIPVRRVE